MIDLDFIIKNINTDLETGFNNWDNPDELNEIFKIDDKEYYLKFYKQNNSFNGTKLNIEYLSKKFNINLEVITLKPETIFNKFYGRYDSTYTYNDDLKYGYINTDKANCAVNYETKIDLDSRTEIIDYPAIIKDIKNIFDYNLYICSYFEDFNPYIQTIDEYKNEPELEYKEKVNIINKEKHYYTYGELGYYGQKIEGRNFYYGDNWLFKPTFKIKPKEDNDDYEVYYSKNKFYYSSSATDLKKNYDIRFINSRKDDSNIYPTPKVKDDYWGDGEIDLKEDEFSANTNFGEDRNYLYYNDKLIYKNDNPLYTITAKEDTDIIIKRKAKLVYGDKSNTFLYYNSVWDTLHNKILHPNYMLNGSYICYKANYDDKDVIEEKNCLWDNFKYADYYQKIPFYGKNFDKDFDIKKYDENFEKDKFINEYKFNSNEIITSRYGDNGLTYGKSNFTYRKDYEDNYKNDLKTKDAEYFIYLYNGQLTYNDNNVKYDLYFNDDNFSGFSYGLKEAFTTLYKQNNKLKYNGNLLYNNFKFKEEQDFIIKRNLTLVYRPDTRVKYYNSVWEIYDNVVLHPNYNKYTKGITYWIELDGNLIKEKEYLINYFNFTEYYIKNFGDKSSTEDIYVHKTDDDSILFKKTSFKDYYEINYGDDIVYNGIDVTFKMRTTDDIINKTKVSPIDRYLHLYDGSLTYNKKYNESFNNITPKYYNNILKTKIKNKISSIDYYGSLKSNEAKYGKDATYTYDEYDNLDEVYSSKGYLEYKKNNLFTYSKSNVIRNTKDVKVLYNYTKLKIKNNDIVESSKVIKENTNDKFFYKYNSEISFNGKTIYKNNYNDKQNNILKTKFSTFAYNIFDGTTKFNGYNTFSKYFSSYEKFKLTIKINHDEEYEDYYIIKDNDYYDLAPYINEENENHDEDYYIRIVYEDFK